MRAVAVLACVLAAVAAVHATLGVDLSQPGCGSGCFECRRNDGYHFAVVRGYEQVNRPDPSVAGSVAAAWAGGMAHVDVYMFPCPTCGDPAGQVRSAVEHLRSNGVKFGMLWFDIEGPQYWASQGDNRNFIATLISEGKALGVNLGIYTSASQWDPIVGAWDGGSGLPLWYAHYDGNPSFSDFRSFGGWGRPAIKQFQGTTNLCGGGVDLNWYPDGARASWPLHWPEAFAQGNATRLH